MIKIEKVNKIYPNGFHAVKDVSLEIKKGDIFGIIGLSGAGKSSLIRLLNRLEEPTSGKIIIDGVDMTSLSKDQLLEKRKKIGMIFQHFNLLSSRTVGENVAFALEIAGWEKSKIKDRVKELLEVVELSSKIDSYPSQLSGGQKQRVSIARAILKDAPIIVFDEATSYSDIENEHKIQLALQNLLQGKTTIMIAHRLHTIRNADHIVVFEDGKAVEQGTHDELVAREGRYSHMWDTYIREMVGKE